MNITGWYALYLREIWIFKKRLFKLSYVLSSMVTPIIYLLTFGLGLGQGMGYDGYLAFLLPGLVMMSGMNNAYTWVCSSINIGRLMHKSFQMHLMAPVTSKAILIAHLFSGITKGAFGMFLILVVGIFFIQESLFYSPFWVAMVLNLTLFSALGIIVGIIVKSHEETATWSNFIMTPMAFFSGTFFPIDHYPTIIKWIIYCTPLTHANILARKTLWDEQAWISCVILLCYTIILVGIANYRIKTYSE
jgi:ABC-2 type transport system permease protein